MKPTLHISYIIYSDFYVCYNTAEDYAATAVIIMCTIYSVLCGSRALAVCALGYIFYMYDNIFKKHHY